MRKFPVLLPIRKQRRKSRDWCGICIFFNFELSTFNLCVTGHEARSMSATAGRRSPKKGRCGKLRIEHE